MGHCKHQWVQRTEVLRDVFPYGDHGQHAFYVCSRCLKIDEVLAPPVALERPLPAAAWSKDERAA